MTECTAADQEPRVFMPGLYTDLSNDEYHKSAAVGSSGLKLILQSPAHFRYPPKRDVTRAKDIGSAIHCAILEPERFKTDYRIVDCEDRRSAIYKAACKDMDGSYVLTIAEADNVKGMQAGVMRNRSCRELIEAPGQQELSLFVKDPVTGVMVKVRYDKLINSSMPVDLKKTQEANADKFRRAITNYSYHLSAALYMDAWEWLHGEKLEPMRWIAVEEKSPNASMRYVIEEESLAYGRAQYREALNIYADCLEKDEWPAYGDDEQECGVTSWAINEFEDGLEVSLDD